MTLYIEFHINQRKMKEITTILGLLLRKYFGILCLAKILTSICGHPLLLKQKYTYAHKLKTLFEDLLSICSGFHEKAGD